MPESIWRGGKTVLLSAIPVFVAVGGHLAEKFSNTELIIGKSKINVFILLTGDKIIENSVFR